MTCLTITRRLGIILVVTGNFACGNFAYGNLRAVILCAVILRAAILRAIILRAAILRAVILRAVIFRTVILRAVILRTVILRTVIFRMVTSGSYCSRPVQPMNSPIHRIPDDFFYCGRSAEVLQLVHVTSPAVGDGLCLS